MADQPEKQAVLYERAAAYASLLDNPAFRELQQEADRKTKRVERVVLANVFSDGADLMFVSRQRGFIDGMNYIVRLVPQGAQADLIEWAEKEVSR